jgi:trimeric autotransporter adhesin
MNSFKKIALAVVAAMTLGTMVATPASAAVMTVAVDLAGTPNTTASAIATPASLPVPADNSVDAADALKFVATVDTGTAVSVVATNATIVSALHTSAAPVGATSGTSSLTIATGTGTTATFWVYTKTTAIGTVTVTNQGTTFTYYVQGTAGKINNLAVSAPSSGAAGTKQDILVTATDVFGNKVSAKSITATVFAATATLDSATATTGATLSDFGVAKFTATLPATGTRSLIMFAPTTSSDANAADVVGLTARTLAPFAEVTVRDLVSELAAEKSAKDAALAAKAISDAAVVKAAADAAAAKVVSDAALAAEKAASAAALAAEKAASAKALADAKTASDAVVLAKDATIAKLTADNAAALKSIKDAFNALAKKWNAKNPKAKVTYVK